MLKKHLLAGVDKGALTEEEANKKFEAWLEEKNSKVDSANASARQKEDDAKEKALAAEKEVSAKREAEAKAAAEAEAAEAAESETEETQEAEESNEEDKA